MPDQPVETPAVTPAPSTPTSQDASREAVYQKLYGDTPAAPAAAPAADAFDYKSAFTQLNANFEAMKADLAARATQPTVPTTPALPPEDWFDHLQHGRRTEAEKVLVDNVTNKAAAQITKDTLAQAIDLMRTEHDIESFNDQTRQNNSDLLDVEDLISLKAEQYFRAAPQPKSTKEFTETYKGSVTKAVEDMRKVLQRTRAVAKSEAMTVQREVLGASTVTPNQITSVNREITDANASQVPDNSPETYMAMRNANANLRKNPWVGDQHQRVVGL